MWRENLILNDHVSLHIQFPVLVFLTCVVVVKGEKVE